jgi:hypothetical protein
MMIFKGNIERTRKAMAVIMSFLGRKNIGNFTKVYGLVTQVSNRALLNRKHNRDVR